MAPVLSLVLDEDVSSDVALMYPELYQELMKGRSLTFKTFFIWVLVSIYQGKGERERESKNNSQPSQLISIPIHFAQLELNRKKGKNFYPLRCRVTATSS